MPVTINGSGPVTGVTAITGAGLDLITTQTFTGASAVNVNGCFTATYDAYFLAWTIDTFAASAALSFRLRASNADNSTANYAYGGSFTNYAGTLAGDGGTGGTSWSATTQASHAVLAMSLYSPQRVAITYGNADITGGTSQAKYGYRFGATTQFDGISLLSSQNATGTLRVYGYRNS